MREVLKRFLKNNPSIVTVCVLIAGIIVIAVLGKIAISLEVNSSVVFVMYVGVVIFIINSDISNKLRLYIKHL